MENVTVGHELGLPSMSMDPYSAYDADVNRRLEHAETRIKYWVIAGICVNLIALIAVGTPLVYYLGALSATSSQAIAAMNKAAESASIMNHRVDEIEHRQELIIQHLQKTEGFALPETIK